MTNNIIKYDKAKGKLKLAGVLRLFLPKERAIFDKVLNDIKAGEVTSLDIDISELLHVDLTLQYFLFKYAERLNAQQDSLLKVTANDNLRIHRLLVSNFYRFNPKTDFTFTQGSH